jgi:hypothetical protein
VDLDVNELLRKDSDHKNSDSNHPLPLPLDVEATKAQPEAEVGRRFSVEMESSPIIAHFAVTTNFIGLKNSLFICSFFKIFFAVLVHRNMIDCTMLSSLSFFGHCVSTVSLKYRMTGGSLLDVQVSLSDYRMQSKQPSMWWRVDLKVSSDLPSPTF